jgi:hypothetical protein
MSNRILEYVQRGLIAALSVVLALVVWTMFKGVLETPAGNATEGVPEAATTIAPEVTTTLTPEQAQTPGAAPSTTTTTVAVAFVAPWGEGPCSEQPPEIGEDESLLRVYYNCGTGTEPTATTFVYRRVPSTSRVLTNTFRQLVRGPNDGERGRGFGSFFDGNVTIESVSLSEGRAIIDFGGLDAISDWFVTQEAVEFFLANLGANAFQFSSVQAVEYRADGNCSGFWELVGGDRCDVISRNQWLASVEPNR